MGARRWTWVGLAGVLALALGLRVWGIAQGLPYVYNVDEGDHFVPGAVAMFAHGLNPHYFANPPALTYALHFLLAVWYGGREGVLGAYKAHPEHVYVLARAIVAALGTAAVWLLYVVGSRLFDRGVGLLAAAIEGVAFLPVFYAHLALNDVAAMAPLTLSLLGAVGVLRRGRLGDHLLAGVGLGLACATKYTAGIVLAPVLAAIALRALEPRRGGGEGAGESGVGHPSASKDPPGEGEHTPAGRRVGAPAGVALVAGAALVAFLLANPYSVLDYAAFHHGLVHQSTLAGEAQGKLGAPANGGLAYYLWTLTWGLGWIPALAALGGAGLLWRKRPALAWLLIPAPIAYLLFMGLQGRYFGRWLLPIFPLLCLLAAFFALTLARELGARALRVRPAVVAIAAAAVCAQGVIYSVHSGVVLSRADTRNLTRSWMVVHVPAGSPIVVEPVVPNGWVTDAGVTYGGQPPEARWQKYPSLRLRLNPRTGVREAHTRVVRLEDYERTLGPALIPFYEQRGYCWVISGSTQAGRAFADPGAVPGAVAYYRALVSQASVVHRSSPYRTRQPAVPFGFDWSFDYYPLAYARPGPEMTVYRLHGGRCGTA